MDREKIARVIMKYRHGNYNALLCPCCLELADLIIKECEGENEREWCECEYPQPFTCVYDFKCAKCHKHINEFVVERKLKFLFPPKEKPKEINRLDETWDNPLSMAYGSIYTIAMENRKLLNKLCQAVNRIQGGGNGK